MSHHMVDATSSNVSSTTPISPSPLIIANSNSRVESETRHNFSLYNDAVQHILQYSSLSTLHIATQLSKQWYHVIRSMKPLQLHLHSINHQSLRGSTPAYSVVGLHVSSFSSMLCFNLRCLTKSRLSLGVRFPNLRRGLTLLSVSSEELEHPLGIHLPKLVEELDVHVQITHLPKIIAAVGELSALTKLSFQFDLENCFTPPNTAERHMDLFLETSFKPLTKLKNLQRLELVYCLSREAKASMASPPSAPVPPSLLSCIRSMSALNSLKVYDRLQTFEWDMKNIIQRLAQQPHNLHQLTSLNFSLTTCKITPSVFESLLLFPTIQRLLSTPLFNPNQFLSLARFTNLKELHLISNDHPELTYEGMLFAVRSCPRLEELEIWFQPLTNEQLDEMLSVLPSLSKLRLQFCKHISSLSVLSHYGLPERLTHLSINYCGPMKEPEIEFISQLRSLVQLDVSKSFDPPSDQQRQQRLSKQMPNLRRLIELS